MSGYEYKTIPFVGATKEKDKSPASTLARQLDALVNSTAIDGWEFHRVDHLSIVINNGCLASLTGNAQSTRAYDVITFRRPRAE